MSSKRNQPRTMGVAQSPPNSFNAVDQIGFGGKKIEDTQLSIDLERAVESSTSVLEGGALQIGKFTLTPIGLQVRDNPSIEHWMQVGEILRRMEASIQWLIGDWLVFGEREYKKTYEELSTLTGYEIKSLYNYAYVANIYHFSMRIEKLTFTHHQTALAAPPEKREELLNAAAENNWSVAMLRSKINGTDTIKDDKFAALFTQIRMRAEKQITKAAKHGQREQARSLIADLRRWLDELERKL